MDPTNDPTGASLKRINALLAWWGVPKISGMGATDREIRRFQDFAADLQTLYGDAAGLQVRALLTTNEGIARALCQLLQQRRPQDLLAAESSLVASVLESAAVQAKTWIDVSQQMNARCAAFAREATTDFQTGNSGATNSETFVSP
jgi:hypothetical protein